jgi:RHS repeat-associated protein
VFAYDRANRPWSITNKIDSTQSIAFDYDADGNRTKKTIGTITTTLDADGFVVVDAKGHGQVTVSGSAKSTSYFYGIRDELLKTNAIEGGFVTFDYDHDLLRVKKRTELDTATGVVITGETRYLYDDRATLLEYGPRTSTDPIGKTRVKYDYGLDLLTRVDVSAATNSRIGQFYLQDGLGSTSELADASGTPQETYKYDAWGNILTPNAGAANARLYTGHYFDKETGLDYFGARYYDASVGEFITQDTYLGETNIPASLHRYMLAYDNPTRYIDLFGYSSDEATTKRGGTTKDDVPTEDPKGKHTVHSTLRQQSRLSPQRYCTQAQRNRGRSHNDSRHQMAARGRRSQVDDGGIP